MFVYLHYSFYANYLFINKNVRCCRYFELFSLQFTIEIRNNKSVTDNFVFSSLLLFPKVSANFWSHQVVSDSNNPIYRKNVQTQVHFCARL